MIAGGQIKEAASALQAYTRTKIRESSYRDKIVTPQKVNFSNCDRQMDTVLPVIIFDKENDIPPALSVTFGSSPNELNISAPKYKVVFNRILTHKYYKDLAELGMYHMDVRQVTADNSVRELLAEKDGTWMSAFTNAIGSMDVTHPLAGAPLWKSQSGGMTRINVVESLKGMNRTIWNLESETCLTNMVTFKNFMMWGRDEMGGDLSQQIVKDGMIEVENFLNRRWIVTIKRGQVVDDVVNQFANEKFVGKNLTLEEPTMFLDRKAFWIEFFFYAAFGAAFGHIGGLFRTTYT
jgi:hypothetical protein